MSGSGALAGIRVLDLTETYAAYAGRLLADLGADVIRVEGPSGSPVRALEPRRAGGDSPTSYAHAFLDAGKRSVVIDLTQPSGRDRLCQLAATSDVVIDTPSEANAIEPVRWRAANPKLVVASVTPFGLDGPRAKDAAGDIGLLAAGGLLSLGGYRDSEPVAIAGAQAQLASGIFTAVAVLAALCSREQSHEGVWLDISGQECVAFALEDAVPEWYIAGRRRCRLGDTAREAGSGIYPCRDGYISMLAGRLGTAKAFAALTRWVAESGCEGAAVFLEPQWQDFRYRQSSEGIARFSEIFGAFCRTRGKQELYREGQARQIAIAPVNTIADLLEDAQLSANSYFHSQRDPVSRRDVLFPGAPYRLSRTPAEIRSPAPALGAHDRDILGGESVETVQRAPANLV